MSEIILNATIKPRSDTKENWNSNNPTLKENEIGVEKSYVEDGISFGPRLKIGTGTTAWNSLQYLSVGQSVGSTSYAIGLGNNATHEYVTLIGHSLKSDNNYQTIVGRANKQITEPINSETGKPLFCVGNGATSDSDGSNAMYVDEYGNIVASKNIYVNGNKNVTDLADYTSKSTTINLLLPLDYDTGISIGRYIKITKQSDGSFLLENTSSSSTGSYSNNSIGFCSSGNYKILVSFKIKQKTNQSDSVYCKVINTQLGMVQQGIAYPATLSSSTEFVSVNPPELQTGGYSYYYINVPYGCSCYVKDINITVNDNVISQVIGYRGTLDPVEYHNIKSKTDSVLNTFGGTSYDITPFFVFHHTISKNDWTDNTAKLPVPTDILDYLLTPLILGYDMSTADDFDMCANAKIVVGNFPDYDSGSDSYFYQITALGTVPTKSITIYYTFLTESTSL